MKSSLEIAQEAELVPIEMIAESCGLQPEEIEPYGRYKAKIGLGVIDRLADRPERRLAQARDGLLADRAEALGEPDERRRLALARLRRRHARDDDDLAVRPVLQTVEDVEADLRLVPPVGLDLIGFQSAALRDLVDRDELRFLRDLEAGLHRTPSLVLSG